MRSYEQRMESCINMEFYYIPVKEARDLFFRADKEIEKLKQRIKFLEYNLGIMSRYFNTLQKELQTIKDLKL